MLRMNLLSLSTNPKYKFTLPKILMRTEFEKKTKNILDSGGW